MPVRIRLARFGRRNLPFYRIFVADSRSPRDGRHLEVVGHFDPIPGAHAAADARSRRSMMGRTARERVLSRCAQPCSALCHARVRALLRLAGAGKDGNKHVGLNFDRIKCVGARRQPTGAAHVAGKALACGANPNPPTLQSAALTRSCPPACLSSPLQVLALRGRAAVGARGAAAGCVRCA